MSLTPKQYVLVRAPQYTDDIRVDTYISIATGKTGLEYGDCYNEAVGLRALHMLTKDSMSGGSSSNTGIQNSGQITGEKEGKLSRSYSKPTNSNGFGDLSTTGYGQELIELAKGCLFLPRNRQVG